MRSGSDISIGNLVPAALGGVAAALVLSYFGVAGSLVGAAVGPVVYLLVKELSRGPTERAVARAGGGRPREAPFATIPAPGPPIPRVGARSRRRIGLAWLLATAAVASIAAVALITIPELISGRSILGGDRGTTFFDPGGGSSGGGGGTEAPAPTDTTDPATTTEEPAVTDGETTAPAEEPPPVTEAPPEEPPEEPVTDAPATEAPAVEAPPPAEPTTTAP